MKYIVTENNFGHVMQQISTCPTDGTYQVEITKVKKSRTTAQNSLYWMWLREISASYAESHGEYHSSEIFHQYLKRLFLGQEPVTINGNHMVAMVSTGKLNTKEMTDYLEKIDHWAGSELEIQLPHPQDIYYEAMEL